LRDQKKEMLVPWSFNLREGRGGIPRKLAEGIHSHVFPGKFAMLSVVHLEPNAVGRIHSHPEEQWGVLLEGECIRIQYEDEVPMVAGDFWHTPGGVPHGIRAGAEGALVLDIFSPLRPEYKITGEGFGNP
jgi:quercetin dioxygenase-like cupin family protein